MKKEPWNKLSEKELFKMISKTGFVLLNYYFIGKSRKIVVQDKIGYKYDILLNNFKKNKNPEFVGKGNPFSLYNISIWLKNNKKQFRLIENNVFEGAKSKLFFICLNKSCGETFDAIWNNVYSKDYGCPYCSGKRVGEKNNLFKLRPDLILDWDFNKNNKSPEMYTEHSGEKVWWLCHTCNNSWKAHINRRSSGTKCPKCSFENQESLMAKEIKTYIKEKFSAKVEYPAFRNPKTSQWLLYDIYIPYGKNPEINGVYIEINGEQHYKLNSWHKSLSKKRGTSPEEEFEYQKYKDKIKKKFAKRNGFFIEINIKKFKSSQESICYIESSLNKIFKQEETK